jgi:Protein of unknown function (DUF3969)
MRKMAISSVPMMFQMNDDRRSVDDQRAELSQLVAVMSLGMCAAIGAGGVSLEEAERRLFNPQVLMRLAGLGVSEDLMEIVHLGTELEDVQSVIPDRLAESLAEIQTKALAFLHQETARSGLAA